MSSKKRRGLGRGLDALLGEVPEPIATPATSGSAVSELAVERLQPNRFQPRGRFETEQLDELADSIRSQGIVQPIVVARAQGDGFTIIAGERRWRAAKQAGLESVPVVVREVADDQQLLELALVENIQRADLNAIEEADAYQMLADRFSLSQEDIAQRVGKARSTITNFLRLLRLPAAVQDLLREGQLTAGQARPLLGLAKQERQLELAEQAAANSWSARKIEAIVARGGLIEPEAKAGPELDVHTREAVDKLTQRLQTKVDIRRKKRGGTVHLHFHSEDELIRLYDLLMTGD